MNILAIDTSGPTCGVAILADGAVRFSQTVLNKRTHSVNLMPMVDAAFTFTGLTLADMDRLACVAGPGSFTGVRLGVSTVKGLAHGSGKPCVAVNALEAMALGAGRFDGIVCPMQDARAGQVYAALFQDGQRIGADEPVALTELAKALLARNQKVLFTGDGMWVHRERIRDLMGETAVFADASSSFLRPETVAEIAEKEENTLSYLDLMPLYLRAPSAERNRRLMEAQHD